VDDKGKGGIVAPGTVEKLLALAAAVLVLSAAPAFALNFYETKQLAMEGVADAQYNLGKMYEIGQGVEADMEEAVKWYLKAAGQGHAQAEIRVGLMHMHGVGLEKDAAKAAEYLSKAAEKGYAEAQFNLGLLYMKGEGVVQDMTQAKELFRKAAMQKHEKAKELYFKLRKEGY
jgi:TPR repeat protein